MLFGTDFYQFICTTKVCFLFIKECDQYLIAKSILRIPN